MNARGCYMKTQLLPTNGGALNLYYCKLSEDEKQKLGNL